MLVENSRQSRAGFDEWRPNSVIKTTDDGETPGNCLRAGRNPMVGRRRLLFGGWCDGSRGHNEPIRHLYLSYQAQGLTVWTPEDLGIPKKSHDKLILP